MIVRAFVSGPEREALLAKALAHMSRGELTPNASGPGRYFAKADEAPGLYVDPLLAALTHRCERCLRTAGMAFDGGLGRIISLIMPGGFIHRHRDAYHEGVPGHRPGSDHLRCNIVVSFPHPSAAPVIDGEALQLDEARRPPCRPTPHTRPQHRPSHVWPTPTACADQPCAAHAGRPVGLLRLALRSPDGASRRQRAARRLRVRLGRAYRPRHPSAAR